MPARHTAPRNDATPLLGEQSVTVIAPRNNMESIASTAKSAKFSDEEDEVLVYEVQGRAILWSLKHKDYKNVDHNTFYYYYYCIYLLIL